MGKGDSSAPWPWETRIARMLCSCQVSVQPTIKSTKQRRKAMREGGPGARWTEEDGFEEREAAKTTGDVVREGDDARKERYGNLKG